MRVVIAPDSFGGTLSARAAAQAIADGWTKTAPADELTLLPLADGGTGFVDVLHAARGGEWHEREVTGPLGEPVRACWLRLGDTAYLESAAACGLHLLPRRDPATARAATSRGVGELMADALAAGVTEIVVGLGGSGTTDGGAGMLAALGAQVVDATGEPLPPGGAALARAADWAAAPAAGRGAIGPGTGGAATTGPRPARTGGAATTGPRPARPAPSVEVGRPGEVRRAAGGLVRLRTAAGRPVRLVAAADVDNPLLGPHGAAAVFGPQKGADAATVAELDVALATFADVLAGLGRDVRDEPGAGAAGGLGAALLALGAERVSGAALVRGLVGLDAALDAADLAITGEGSFDWQSLRGKLITAVAQGAAERGVPCLVLAGQVTVGRREAAAAGVDAAFAVTEHAGGLEASLADPAGTLAALASRVAGTWSRG